MLRRGGVDFIFGPATAVFRDCEIRSKRKGYVTAASTPQEHPFGFVFLNCRLTRTPELEDDSVYLGRPWRDYAAVTYINCEMGPHIRAAGWDNWRNPAREKTARYCEYHSTGRGGGAKGRVGWARQLGDEEAKKITVEAVLGGEDHWNPAPTDGR